tara:strand:+ start:5362 stop:6153 length:792 start_codon:yes stop_codon:yes gene_type:complete
MEKTNVVFIVDVKLEGTQKDVGRWAQTRSSPYMFSIKSWKKWCDKNSCELFVLNDLVLPHNTMPVSWQRYYIFDLLEASGINYDQIMYVDADTIPHPDCPNVFELSDRKFCFVHNEGSYDWILRSIENYSKHFFNNYTMPWCDYFDSGMMIFNETHKTFFKDIIDFFHENKERLLEAENIWHAGTDQTPVNFLTHIKKIDYKKLPYEFNMCDMHRKELLGDDLLFTKWGWIYQYNSIPNNVDDKLTYHWMEKTYKHLWENKNG